MRSDEQRPGNAPPDDVVDGVSLCHNATVIRGRSGAHYCLACGQRVVKAPDIVGSVAEEDQG